MRKGVVLADRDILMMRFVYDMKVVHLEHVYNKFFNFEGSKSDKYAYKRVRRLEDDGYIFRSTVGTSNRKFLGLTPTGIKILEGKYPNEDFPSRSHQFIDYRNLDHDLLVIKCREHLEEKGKAVKWISEQSLRINIPRENYGFTLAGRTANYNIPDGIFVDNKNVRWAFELERSVKKASRLVMKLKTLVYESLLEGCLWDKVFFVVTSDGLEEIILDKMLETKGFKEGRVLADYSKFFKLIKIQTLFPDFEG